MTQRMQVQQLVDGTRIVNDTYNANPVSVVAAVEAVAAVRGDGLSLRCSVKCGNLASEARSFTVRSAKGSESWVSIGSSPWARWRGKSAKGPNRRACGRNSVATLKTTVRLLRF